MCEPIKDIYKGHVIDKGLPERHFWESFVNNMAENTASITVEFRKGANCKHTKKNYTQLQSCEDFIVLMAVQYFLYNT